MIRLSYTSLNNLFNGHEWLNRQMGVKIPDYPFLQEGKDGHAIFQKHVSGVEKSPLLKHIQIEFSIVESDLPDTDSNYWKEKEKCKFSFVIEEEDKQLHGIKGDYEIVGYYDGRKEDFSQTIEGKFSSTVWSVGKFKESMQRKIYALSNDAIKEQFLIAGLRDPEQWKQTPPKLYSIKPTKEDKQEAWAWIIKGIKILESGNFKGGLDENGKCLGCFWNMARYRNIANCAFL